MDGDSDRYDAELRPELMRRAIAELQDAGVEADIWKIEGVDERADCELIAAQCRAGGRDGVVCVVLGRGADNDKVDHWLRQAAPVEGYVGFAIGRSIWGEPLEGFIDGSLSREDAAAQVADNYLRFVEVYTSAGRQSASGQLAWVAETVLAREIERRKFLAPAFPTRSRAVASSR